VRRDDDGGDDTTAIPDPAQSDASLTNFPSSESSSSDAATTFKVLLAVLTFFVEGRSGYDAGHAFRVCFG
jgi:hypothetical protein